MRIKNTGKGAIEFEYDRADEYAGNPNSFFLIQNHIKVIKLICNVTYNFTLRYLGREAHSS